MLATAVLYLVALGIVGYGTARKYPVGSRSAPLR